MVARLMEESVNTSFFLLRDIIAWGVKGSWKKIIKNKCNNLLTRLRS